MPDPKHPVTTLRRRRIPRGGAARAAPGRRRSRAADICARRDDEPAADLGSRAVAAGPDVRGAGPAWRPRRPARLLSRAHRMPRLALRVAGTRACQTSCRGSIAAAATRRSRRFCAMCATEASARRVGAFVFVGDAMEEREEHLFALAGELGLLGVKGFVFQEGENAAPARVFREIARLTGGAYAVFDASAPARLASLLAAAAAYAAGGRAASGTTGAGRRKCRPRSPRADAVDATMPQLLIAILILGLGWYGLKFFARASPRDRRANRALRRRRRSRALSACCCCCAAVSISALPASGFAAVAGRPAPARVADVPAGRGGSTGTSRVRSAMIEMELDHATGAMRGRSSAARRPAAAATR